MCASKFLQINNYKIRKMKQFLRNIMAINLLLENGQNKYFCHIFLYPTTINNFINHASTRELQGCPCCLNSFRRVVLTLRHRNNSKRLFRY